MAAQYDPLTEKINSCTFQVHNALGPGFLEKVYENALAIALRKQGLRVTQQQPIRVYYDDEVVGEYCADLCVEELIIAEVKAITTLRKAHEVQLVSYLAATRLDIGLLINFGRSVEIKRKYRVHRLRGSV